MNTPRILADPRLLQSYLLKAQSVFLSALQDEQRTFRDNLSEHSILFRLRSHPCSLRTNIFRNLLAEQFRFPAMQQKHEIPVQLSWELRPAIQCGPFLRSAKMHHLSS